MKSTVFYALIGLGALVVGGIIWWGVHSHPKAIQNIQGESTATSSTPSLTGFAIYTNGEYGFSVFYPEKFKTETAFDMYYHVTNAWSQTALPNATGTPILAIIGYQTKSDSSYPRYFDTEVRIGVSTDPKEVAACEQNGTLPTKVINGTTWAARSLDQAGMMQYAKGVEYRTKHDGACVSLTQLQAGSSYRDDPASAKDISDTVLQSHYDELTQIVQSFSFAKP